MNIEKARQILINPDIYTVLTKEEMEAIQFLFAELDKKGE